ncbi:sigma-54-dependent transcriptional regulator [Roseibium polysiphoniae]|uniref:Sigma-54-dependent Fis family transcriptional regulator n=1 Tax=Roseibium polysiphoniae TaxID=2571221 RepID=A0ABR9CCQ2_9HYPH|nr:sigma-54 dependent transcriptional regulator [Roseibium polysiphoniae]MBD8876682.1 sigma-54-dependent Fis family transcriptional regulator [Roseibium polysiphoniae]
MRPDGLTIGLIEDDPVMGGSLVQRLELEGCAVRWWQTGQEALFASSGKLADLDLVLCDIRLPDMDGEEIYRNLLGERSTPPVIFITGYGEIGQAVRLMRLGAADYVTKPFGFDDFLSRIRDNARNRTPAPDGDTVLGVSPAMRKIAALLRQFARSDLPVLITGETGAGKEIAARYLHNLRNGEDARFMAVNCAAIPPDLLESEIFGHEKGAFTGATKRHLGYAERAGSGTLFLDEIGDMPLPLQAKILRLIEDRCFHRVGGEEIVPFNARIVTATHRKLTDGSGNAGFRSDLYFRIAVLPVDIPPLSERPEDIIRLMAIFLAEAVERHDKIVRGVSSLTEETALGYDWPGNVRELRNRVERGVALAAGEWLMPADLFPDRPGSIGPGIGFAPLSEIRDDAERRQIVRALAETSGHIQEAARLLGISRTTLWEKMTRLGIKTERSEN